MHGERAVVGRDGAVEIDHAADEFRREDTDAAEVEQVDAEIRPYRVVAEMRFAVNDDALVERHIPGATEIKRDVITTPQSRGPEVPHPGPVEPAHGRKALRRH